MQTQNEQGRGGVMCVLLLPRGLEGTPPLNTTALCLWFLRRVLFSFPWLPMYARTGEIDREAHDADPVLRRVEAAPDQQQAGLHPAHVPPEDQVSEPAVDAQRATHQTNA